MLAKLENDKFFYDLFVNKIIYFENGLFYYTLNKKPLKVGAYEYRRLKHGKKAVQEHRLIWIIHNGLITDKKLQINHIDGNKHNNKIENLELVTNQQNVQHSYDFLNPKINNPPEKTQGEKNGMSLFKDEDVIELRKKFLEGKITVSQIKNEFNTSERAAQYMLIGNHYKHLPNAVPREKVFAGTGGGRKSRFTPEVIKEMKAMRQSGKTNREIADKFKCDKRTVPLLLNEKKTKGSDFENISKL